MIWVVEQAQDADGVPHFCYHDSSTGLDFVWDGLALEIDVSRDGDVVDRYSLPVGTHSATRNPGMWLAHFQIHCQIYTREKTHERSVLGTDPDGVLPRGVARGKGEEATH